ncbi:hypothetical protein, partial [Chryseobacterium ureilyticum]|uniref:hypothetical protein n=1 Tax=Chryseobacterium ureilyticum TaxID=373668 RepID=UPI001E5137BB
NWDCKDTNFILTRKFYLIKNAKLFFVPLFLKQYRLCLSKSSSALLIYSRFQWGKDNNFIQRKTNTIIIKTIKVEKYYYKIHINNTL